MFGFLSKGLGSIGKLSQLGRNVGKYAGNAVNIGKKALSTYKDVRGHIDKAVETGKAIKGALESTDGGKELVAGVEKLMNSSPAGKQITEGLGKASDILRKGDGYAEMVAGKMKDVESRFGLSPADQAKELGKAELSGGAAPEPPSPADMLASKME